MSSPPSAYKAIHASPPSRGHNSDLVGHILSQGLCVAQDQEQMLDSELSLTEMTEAEYSHLHHFIQAQMEAQAGPSDGTDARPHPAPAMAKDATGSTGISPNASTQAIDLSLSSDDHCLVMQGEKTPVTYGEVPGFVLAKIRAEESPVVPPATGRTTSQKQSKPAARVCLEKRFNSSCADTARQQDIPSAVLSNLLTVLQESAETQETLTQPQKLKWMKADRANPFEVSGSYVGGVLDPVTNMCSQVIAHMVEPNIHQGFIFPKSFAFKLNPESLVTKNIYIESSNSREEQELVNTEKNGTTPAVYRSHFDSLSVQPTNDAKAALDMATKSQRGGWKRARSSLSVGQRKERHNSMERERRKKIRVCCDDLNTMVPFCNSDTDKVTTLQWTLTYLRYISLMYGDTIKEEFEKFFTQKREMLLKPSSSSGHHPFHQELDETASVPLAAEQ
ncbi:transcription factor-like 5 protein [Kryptolebias marmoratus]|uniref:transcription factor-like 5 protein n=1 Tax=Kryptolebias marmoratus TaxID=37003 RepID=UPI0007F93B41|nr:transcription factor-like 5 protein [Kryptolebias marmoratus]